MSTEIRLTLARAMPDEIERLDSFLRRLEELMTDADSDAHGIGEFVLRNLDGLHGSWERVALGYETLFHNACDPGQTCLAWKPEIESALRERGQWAQLRVKLVELADRWEQDADALRNDGETHAAKICAENASALREALALQTPDPAPDVTCPKCNKAKGKKAK